MSWYQPAWMTRGLKTLDRKSKKNPDRSGITVRELSQQSIELCVVIVVRGGKFEKLCGFAAPSTRTENNLIDDVSVTHLCDKKYR